MKDVIIVGGGIAGTTLAWQWFLQGKSIHWIADDQPSSSHVAAGVFNPVVLKRFSPVWNAEDQLDFLFSFYALVQKYLDSPVITVLPVWRRFHDEKEQLIWKRKAAREDLKNLMKMDTISGSLHGINASNGFGIVKRTGSLITIEYMNKSMDFFHERNDFSKEHFNYEELSITDHHVTYKSLNARAIIFAEGNRLPLNPWFGDLPFQGNKGEILIIKCPGLHLEQIIKSSVFLMPYKEDLFWVGATYDRDYESNEPSLTAREYLISKLETFLSLPYEIVAHQSGIRPTTQDRRPFVGHHAKHKNLYIFNGMGSRASLVAPWASHQLFNSMYDNIALPVEMDIARFAN